MKKTHFIITGALAAVLCSSTYAMIHAENINVLKQDASETEESTVKDYTAYPVNTILNQYSYDISMYSSEKIADAAAHAEEYVQSNIERDGDSGIYLLSPDGVGFFSNCTITDVREDAELIDGICHGEEPHFVDLDGMKQIVIYWNLNDIHE